MTRVNVLSVDRLQTTDLVAEAPASNNKATGNGEFSRLVDDQVQSQQANANKVANVSAREQRSSLKRDDQQSASNSNEITQNEQTAASASEQSRDKLSGETSDDASSNSSAPSASKHSGDDQSASEVESTDELSDEATKNAEIANTQTDKLATSTGEAALKPKAQAKPDDFMTLLAKSEQLLSSKMTENSTDESTADTAVTSREDVVVNIKGGSESTNQAAGTSQAKNHTLAQQVASHLTDESSEECDGETTESNKHNSKLIEVGLAQSKADASNVAQNAKSQVVTPSSDATLSDVRFSGAEQAEAEQAGSELTEEQIANARLVTSDEAEREALAGGSANGLSTNNQSAGNPSLGNQSTSNQANSPQSGKAQSDANSTVAGQTPSVPNQNGVVDENTEQVLDAEQSGSRESDVQLAASQQTSTQQTINQQKSTNNSGSQPSAHVQQLNAIANDGAEEQLAQGFSEAEQQAAELAKQSEVADQQAQLSGQPPRSSFAESLIAANAGQPTATSTIANSDSLTAEQIERLEAVSSKVIDSNLDIKKAQQLQTETINIYRRDFAEAVKDKVMVLVNQKLQQVDIQLDPPELGNVHVRVNLQGDQAAVNFTVQNPQAKDALEQHMDKLRDMLQESGVDVGDANVAQQQQGNGQQQGRMTQGHGAVDEVTAIPDNIAQLVKGSATGIDFYA
ncbi:hypothetical protein DXX93_05480 [Thalassotalea euphylliae]|uniref:Flagellar hook-length control protein-like C-terminal domain-containing protein n=1 Tax=Thalassotalea euphylliae TaxID=1655234 RepID=A0A3E0TNE1_9GAMM|nr:flagellar hook-length control protein FliK [Thalassotalea euphylliae]REL26076.1 hypothetical protein DXX93_05480 [Thalassotalea euphylliae]